MDLGGALGLDAPALVSFVGAGGKKTAMRQLVRETETPGETEEARGSAGGGPTVGYTTTTHMPPPDGVPLVLAAPTAPPWDAERGAKAPSRPVAFARGRVGDPDRARRKVRGYEPATLDALFAAGTFEWLLVKADGARRREFKAPGEDEPVVPSRSTDVVVVASVRAVGAPNEAPAVHRPDRVASLVGRGVGDDLTAADVGAVLARDAGGLKHVPAGARAHLLVNKADTPGLRETARAVVDAARARTDRFETCLVASLAAGRVTVEPN